MCVKTTMKKKVWKIIKNFIFIAQKYIYIYIYKMMRIVVK